MSEESLKNKTLKGVVWSATDTVVRFGIVFVVGIILARLLSPDEYGLIGILSIFMALFEIIIDGGFSNALIRKQGVTETDYGTVFVINMAMSVFMAAAMFCSSWFIADFFNREELVALTQVMSCVVIINALSVVQKARLTKEIDFKTQTKVTTISGIASGAVGVSMAYLGYGIWALVAQQISSSIVNALAIWILNRWIPKITFSKDSFKDMWSFGWKLLVSGLLNTLSGQAQSAVIGKCYLPATLGQYTRAQNFGSMFSSNLTTIIQRVTFPVLSAIQDDPIRLKDSYRRVIKMTVLPTFVCMMMLAAVAKPLIFILIGEKWADSVVYLQILCFSMMLYPLQVLNLNAIQVMGRSDLTLRINIAKNLLMIIPIALGIMFNIYWMLISEVGRNYICYYLNSYYSGPLLKYSIWEQIKDIMPSIGLSMLIFATLLPISYIDIPYIVMITIQGLLGIVIAIGICKKCKLSEYLEFKEIILRKNNKNQ